MSPGILGVHAHVEQAVAQQEQRKLHARPIAAFVESDNQENRDDELEQGAARHPQEFAEERKEDVPGLVGEQLEQSPQAQAAGIAGVASGAGMSATLLLTVMLLWVVVPLMATLLVFQRREL